MEEKNLHAGRRSRMRERFAASGGEGFLPHEVLEMALYNSVKCGDTNETAHRLLEKFGSFSAVFDATMEELCSVPGIGVESAVCLKMYPAVFKLYKKDVLRAKKKLASQAAVNDFCLTLLEDARSEQFSIVCLDGENGVITCKSWQGGMNSAFAPMREIADLCLSVRACAVIAAHPHPDGVAKPSAQDEAFTKRLYFALRGLDVPLLDHVIVAQNKCFSFREHGMIDSFESQYLAMFAK